VKLDIPVPTITNVVNYDRDIPATYQVPRSFVRYQRPRLEDIDATVIYNIDAEDEKWLAENISFGSQENIGKKKSENYSHVMATLTEESITGGETSDEEALVKKPTLSLRTFEHMLDLMEHATALEMIITRVQAERLIAAKIPQLLQIFGPAHTGPSHNQEQKRLKNSINVKTVITDVYNYWVNKRSKLRKPLLRKYWPVTASNDTNPHMVFRPREKEKYKLRKKRQNDPEAFKKMKQLRIDFTKIRALLDLVKKREDLNKVVLDMQCDWFEQRLYEMIDTSALPRESDRLSHDEVETALDIPKLFDTQGLDRGKKKKRKRSSIAKGPRIIPANVGGTATPNTEFGDLKTPNPNPATNQSRTIAADQSHPPSFLYPLKTRETYVTSWDNAVPFITSYVDSIPTETTRFRHRPRIGRGGRVIIDRLPQPGNPKDPPRNVYIIGEGTKMETSISKPLGRMLDLLPEPLDVDIVRRRIEKISAAALDEDEGRTMKAAAPALPSSSNNGILVDDGNDTEAVLVKMSDWTETDEPSFGQEIGPFLGPI
jgi:enhancer of polycomb-like protein